MPQGQTVTVYLPDETVEWLDEHEKSRSEIVREGVDLWQENEPTEAADA